MMALLVMMFVPAYVGMFWMVGYMVYNITKDCGRRFHNDMYHYISYKVERIARKLAWD